MWGGCGEDVRCSKWKLWCRPYLKYTYVSVHEPGLYVYVCVHVYAFVCVYVLCTHACTDPVRCTYPVHIQGSIVQAGKLLCKKVH